MIEFYDNDMSVCAQKVRLVLAEKNLKQLARLEPVALEAHYARMPDEKRRAHVRALVERGLEAPGVGPALRTYRKGLASMADALSRAKWLAGDTYSLADITMLPYVLRLEHLGLDGFWTDLPRIQDWFEAARARPAFEAIQHHLDPQYLAIMKGSSEEYRERIETLTGTKQ